MRRGVYLSRILGEKEGGSALFRNIPQSDLWTEIDPVPEGLPGDETFHVSGPGGECLLRISPEDLRERRLREYAAMRALAPLALNIPRALDFGDCQGGVYTLSSWVEGRPAQELLPSLPTSQQREIGRQAGEILRAMHTVPAPLAPEWAEAYGRRMIARIEAYRAGSARIPACDEFAAYALGHAALLSGRPSTFQHGGYSVCSMVLDASFRLGITGFDRMDYGDPWEEFHCLPESVACSPAFSRALLRAYFQGEPPAGFWPLLALYVAVDQIPALPGSVPPGRPASAESLQQQAGQVRAWYGEAYGASIPNWYAQEAIDEANHAER